MVTPGVTVAAQPAGPLPARATGGTAVRERRGQPPQAGSGSDVGPGRGNGPGVRSGSIPVGRWEKCNLVPVNGKANSSQMVAYANPQNKTGPGGVQWRIFLMTTTDTDAYWHWHQSTTTATTPAAAASPTSP